MADEDLSKLKIDKSVKSFRPARRRKLIYGAVGLLIVLVLGFL